MSILEAELKETSIQVLNFITVICNQREGLVDNGWLDIFCNDCEGQETQQMSPAQFATHVIKLGWEIISVGSATALCPECANAPSVNDWAPGLSEEFARADELDNLGGTE